jgi:mono/diheme cytochrome c family protein
MRSKRLLVLGFSGLGLSLAVSATNVPAQSGGAGTPHGDAATGTSRAGPAAEGAPAAEHVAEGRRVYARHCSNCHGIRMVNPGSSSFDLRKFPRDDKARFVNSVVHGKNTMPAWGDMLAPEEIELLWAYVRSGGRT